MDLVQQPGSFRSSGARPILLDQQLQRLHSNLDGGGGIMGLLLIQSRLLPLLVPDHMEHRSTADAPGGSHSKHCLLYTSDAADEL